MLSVIYAECHKKLSMLSVIMPNVVVPSAVGSMYLQPCLTFVGKASSLPL